MKFQFTNCVEVVSYTYVDVVFNATEDWWDENYYYAIQKIIIVQCNLTFLLRGKIKG